MRATGYASGFTFSTLQNEFQSVAPKKGVSRDARTACSRPALVVRQWSWYGVEALALMNLLKSQLHR